MKTKKIWQQIVAIVMMVVVSMLTVTPAFAESEARKEAAKKLEAQTIKQTSTGHIMVYVAFDGEVIAKFAIKDRKMYDLTQFRYVTENLRDDQAFMIAYDNNYRKEPIFTYDDLVIYYDTPNDLRKQYLSSHATDVFDFSEVSNQTHTDIEKTMDVAVFVSDVKK